MLKRMVPSPANTPWSASGSCWWNHRYRIDDYFHRFTGRNPFGFSGRRIGDLYCGLVRDMSKATEWKQFRRTRHTHDPVDDAKGNAEALLHFETLGLKMLA